MALKTKGAALLNAGSDWQPVNEQPTALQRGIFMDIVGLDGVGKSSLAMSAAELGPLAYVDIDQSSDRARKPENKKVRDGIKILPVRYAVGLTEEAVKASCGEAWLHMESKSKAASADWAKVVVWDTGSEAWEIMRLGSFGTLNPKGNRMDRLYGPVNARFRHTMRSIYRLQGKHFITIHQQKDEYADKMKDGTLQSVKTGNLARTGFKEVAYLADLTVECFVDGDGAFKVRIKNCKLSPNGSSMRGMELEDDQVNFAEIIAMATGTEANDWRK